MILSSITLFHFDGNRQTIHMIPDQGIFLPYPNKSRTSDDDDYSETEIHRGTATSACATRACDVSGRARENTIKSRLSRRFPQGGPYSSKGNRQRGVGGNHKPKTTGQFGDMSYADRHDRALVCQPPAAQIVAVTSRKPRNALYPRAQRTG